MLNLNPETQARSVAGNMLSNARAGLQRSPSFVSIFLYLLGSLLLFALLGAGAVYSPFSYKITFMLVQAASLLVGIFHLFAQRNWLAWFDEDNWAHGTVMTVLAWMAGALGVALLVWVPNLEDRTPPTAFVMATLAAVIPYFFHEAYRAWNRIPMKYYKLWHYQANAQGPDLARMDLSNFMVLHFWMSRRFGESLYHDFSSKAPYEMHLGDLFHIFLTDYNALKPDQSLQYLDEQGQPFGWVFYAKQAWWKPRRYLDPDYSFRDNFLKQGDIIVARRVPR
ncbi:TssN family type VI secretion system protein [Hymenobacter sp. HSC-4F20]|uniref:TssN family type VI secretion system protein n=1 Tax=Hymenobacter sp. HSC-4F20 TaxID=2864135 RepID=UPI001C7361BB|nr:TssN family type VI secretion system protein [Hymenobacter sp. HSC-4F20]MBX0289472.1 TssN family type VI secretion system protein [Hymenobacter sp. HSC-4F20]